MVPINITIPILEVENSFTLDLDSASKAGESLSNSYQNATPFSHTVLDDFLPNSIIQTLLSEFPSEIKDSDVIYKNELGGFRKRQIFPENCSPYVKNFFAFCNSAPMISFLEELTGIQGLISDPYYDGGGFHEISKGGKLGIHADFRINKKLHLARRINVLIYLNDDWKEEFGGELELWDTSKTGPVKNILPIINRCVIFNTDASSFHGHPEPLNCPEDRTRKSLALYYYTASKDIYKSLPSHSTMYITTSKAPLKKKITYFKLRLYNHLLDFLPPVIVRAIRKMKT